MALRPEKQYEILVDLYKHYNDVLLKGVAFVYTIVSGLTAFYIAHSEQAYAHALLVLACLASVLSSFLFIMSRALLTNLQHELREVAERLGLTSYPSVKVLSFFLLVNSIIMALLVIVGAIYLR